MRMEGELKTKPMYECRCDERLKTKAEESTRLGYTGFSDLKTSDCRTFGIGKEDGKGSSTHWVTPYSVNTRNFLTDTGDIRLGPPVVCGGVIERKGSPSMSSVRRPLSLYNQLVWISLISI